MCYHNITKVKLLHCTVNKEQNKHHCSIQSCTTNYSLLQISAYVSDWEQNLTPKQIQTIITQQQKQFSQTTYISVVNIKKKTI